MEGREKGETEGEVEIRQEKRGEEQVMRGYRKVGEGWRQGDKR